MTEEKYWKEREKFDKSRIFNLSQKWKERVHLILWTIVAVKNRLDGYHVTIIGDKRKKRKKHRFLRLHIYASRMLKLPVRQLETITIC